VDIDMTSEPLGRGQRRQDVFLRDIWPDARGDRSVLGTATDPETYRRCTRLRGAEPAVGRDPLADRHGVRWDPSPPTSRSRRTSTIRHGAGTAQRHQTPAPLAIFGDSVTTDHISPAGAIKPSSPAGLYLQEKASRPKTLTRTARGAATTRS
jgi:aconitate hydratase